MRPRPIPENATFGVFSPSSPSSRESLDAAAAVLQARGHRVVYAPHTFDADGHHAGRPEDRASDFVELWADPEIDAIWCARGGSSSLLMWPYVDWDRLPSLPPKTVIGYSDVTSLHCAIWRRLGVPSIHGPVLFELATRTTAEQLDWLLALLRDPSTPRKVPGRAAQTLIGGTCTGRLAGGCLSLFRATIGTPYEIDTDGAILLIEEIGEKPWAVERDLAHLFEAGLLEKAAGFVVGQASDCDDSKTVSMGRIWEAALAPLGKPTVIGYAVGHLCENWALPLGCPAILDASAGTLTLEGIAKR